MITCDCCSNTVRVETNANGTVDVVINRDVNEILLALIKAGEKRIETRVTMSRKELASMIESMFASRAELRRLLSNG